MPSLLCMILAFFSLSVTATELSRDFSDPSTFDAVLNGEIIVEDQLDTGTVFLSVVRAYFFRTHPREYVELITDHPRWPELVKDFREGRTLDSNPEGTLFDWWLSMRVQFGLFHYEFFPTGRQTVKERLGETTVHNLLDGGEMVKIAEQRTRLVPYQGGMLLEDEIRVEIESPSPFASAAKREVKNRLVEMTRGARSVLNANP